VSPLSGKSATRDHHEPFLTTPRIVATLGSKTTVAKKVNKRAILDVDVPKAVETIITPEAPMALRLQSNLLYVPDEHIVELMLIVSGMA